MFTLNDDGNNKVILKGVQASFSIFVDYLSTL